MTPRRDPTRQRVARILSAWRREEPVDSSQGIPQLLDVLRELVRSSIDQHEAEPTLNPTVLVNEVYQRVKGSQSLPWENRAEFLAFVAAPMRRVLVKRARQRRVEEGEAAVQCTGLDQETDGPAGGPPAVDVLQLDEALRGLAKLDPRQGRIVELRYFGGLTTVETAAVLEISPRSVQREWHTARLWLLRALESSSQKTALPRSPRQGPVT